MTIEDNDQQQIQPDNVADDIAAAIAQVEGGDAAPAAAPEIQEAQPDLENNVNTPEQPGDGRERDQWGRFIAKPKVDGKAKTAENFNVSSSETPEETQTASEGGQSASPPQSEQNEGPPPPADWSGKAKTKWNKLPLDVRNEIVADHEARQNSFGPLDRVIGDDRKQALSATYGSVENAVSQLFQLSDFAARDPAAFVTWYAQQRGLNLATLVSNGQPAQTGQPDLTEDVYADPALSQVAKTLGQFNERLGRFETAQQQNAEQQRQAQVNALTQQITALRDEMDGNGNPVRPYFNDVKDMMVNLVRSGQAADFKDAYDMAVYANPTTREAVLAQQLEARNAAQRAELEAKKAAATAVRPSAPQQMQPAAGAGAGSNVRDDVMAAWNIHQDRV